MEHMVIPNHITNIKFNAFSWCDHLKEIDISSSVSELGREMFLACSSLTTIRVDKDNQVFDSRDNSNAIINTELNTLIYGCAGTTIPSSVTAIAPGAFSDSSLEEIMIPGNVVTLGASAFARNRLLKKVIIEPGVKEIGYKAFGECASLETLVIPQSVRSVDDNICSKCPQVEIYCEHHQKPSLWSDDFSLGDKKVYWKKDWEYINGVPTKIN
jgi:hypothetical protein